MKYTLLLFLIYISCTICLGQTNAKSDESNKMLQQIKREAKPVYIKASSDIMELRNAVTLAKKGLVPKKDVVKRFNDLVGGTMGYLTSLVAVDKRLIQSGDAYVTFMYDTEIARIARLKAAELKYRSEN